MRRLPLFLLLLAAGCRSAEVQPRPRDIRHVEQSLGRAVVWLTAKQRLDGSWGSETYGIMKHGHSLTPFVSRSLRIADAHGPADRGLAWARANLGRDGSLGDTVDPADYPCYATAATLVLDARIPAARRYLAACQFLRPGHPEHGGFAFSAKAAEIGGGAHVAEITRTAWAAEALGAFPGAPAALEYLGRCQMDDGGFTFTAVPDGAKAGPGRSYGSATCDGIRALRRFGVPADDARVVRALAWLRRNETYTYNPGFPAESGMWEKGIYYYYIEALAEVYADLGGPEGWKDRMATELIRLQRMDGSWVNEAAAMREDDPVISTALAIEALARCR